MGEGSNGCGAACRGRGCRTAEREAGGGAFLRTKPREGGTSSAADETMGRLQAVGWGLAAGTSRDDAAWPRKRSRGGRCAAAPCEDVGAAAVAGGRRTATGSPANAVGDATRQRRSRRLDDVADCPWEATEGLSSWTSQ